MRAFESVRSLLAPWGDLRSQLATDWDGDFPLPPVVADFYREVGPFGPVIHEHIGPVGLTFATGGNPVEVPPLRRLSQRQAGYRWHGTTGEPLPGWAPQWLVVATEGANPFILDMTDGRVYFDLAGGGWSPRLFAPDLATAMGAIATVANALDALGEAAWDDDGELDASARAQVVGRLDDFLGGVCDAETLLQAWRWHA